MADLSRALTVAESQWLMQHSLICLDAKLSPEAAAAATKESLVLALEVARRAHPYLNVSIDIEKKAFRPALATPLSVETLDAGDSQGDSADAVRTAAQRQLSKGVDREQSLARAHLLSCGQQETHLMLFCDHVALDARSLTVWLGDIMAALLGDEGTAETMHEFVDWTTRVPAELTFAPFEPRGTSVVLDKLTPTPEALAAVPSPDVLDVIACVEPETFAALKAATKSKHTTLNAPLSAAFAAAVLDTARKQHPEDVAAPAYVQGCCAVDLRAHVVPPLPTNYCNNSSSIVPIHTTFPAGAALWKVAATAQADLAEAIEAHEMFRLNDITKRAAFAEFGPIFAIPALWSNVGHISTPGVASAEVHIAGAATNPVISGHVTEAAGNLTLTVTYSPLFYDEATPGYIAERFVHHVTQLSTGDEDTPYW